MKKRTKKEVQRNRIIIIVVIVLILGIIIFFASRPKLQVISVVSEIEDYDYYIESNATKLYKKYYSELEEELVDNKVDEENYAKLIAKLFVIDYYTLNNKITNKDIGGVQFIHSELQEKFITEAAETVYKYVKNNLYGTRKQKLPEVSSVEVKNIKNIKYSNGDYKDDSGYQITLNVEYVKNYDYPDEVTLTLIHENNKLVIVEIE